MTTKAKKLIVYGHDSCWQARRLALTLEKLKIDHEWRDIMNGDPVYAEELKALARGYLSVPTVIFPDGTVMVEPYADDVIAELKRTHPGLLKKS